MRPPAIMEYLASSSVKSNASPRTHAPMNSSSSNKNHASSFPPTRRRFLKHLQSCIILLFGLLLCVLFVAFALCTVEGSTHLAGKRNLQVRNSLRYQGRALMQDVDSIGRLAPSQFRMEHTFTNATHPPIISNEPALHGLGSVYMRGTKTMANLIIANLHESCDLLDFRLFLRTLYRSGTMSRADLVLLFPWPSLPRNISDILKEEIDYFAKLHDATTVNIPDNSGARDSLGGSEETSERKMGENTSSDRRRGQTFWGVNHTSRENQQSNFFDPDFGSVVGFSMSDLDPADTFSEFLRNPSSQLRRWLCYEMLLGLLRFKFRLVMLVELGGVVVVGDVFARAKRKDFLYLTLEDSTWADMAAGFEYDLLRPNSSFGVAKQGRSIVGNKHTRGITTRLKDCRKCSKVKQKSRNLLSHPEYQQPRDSNTEVTDGEEVRVSERAPDVTESSGTQQGLMEIVYGREFWNSLGLLERQRKTISSRAILSSMRAAKGLASSMSVEIVRIALQRSSQLSFPDRAILSYLVQKSPHLLGRRVADNLRVMENSHSPIHSVESLKPEDVVMRSQDVQNFSILHASCLNSVQGSDSFGNQHTEPLQSKVTASLLILAKICTSSTNASEFYPDCDQEQVQVAKAMLET